MRREAREPLGILEPDGTVWATELIWAECEPGFKDGLYTVDGHVVLGKIPKQQGEE